MRRALQSFIRLAVMSGTVVLVPALAEEPLDEPPLIIQVEPVIIEGETIRDRMTPEEIRKKFEEILGQPPQAVLKERWVADDTVLVETRWAKYCVKFVPPHLRGVGESAAGFSGLCMGY